MRSSEPIASIFRFVLLSFISLAGMWTVVHLRSGKVRRWKPGSGLVHPVGRVGVRQFGANLDKPGDHVIVLIPGIAASEAYFGQDWDELGSDARVFVVDTVGFGSTADRVRSDDVFGVVDHVEALESGMITLGVVGHPVTLVGHSMGASLAISWAAASGLDIRGVMAFDAPLYASGDEAHTRVGKMGWFEALLASGPLAEKVCEWMCAHHRAARIIAIIANPLLPSRIAADGVKHTWLSYIGPFTGIVSGDSWRAALEQLNLSGIPVRLVNGESDPVPVPGRADDLARRFDHVTTISHPGGHDLPIASAKWCVSEVRRFDASFEQH